VFELIAVRKGVLTAGFESLVDTSLPGVVKVDLAQRQALAAGSGGSVIELDLRVRAGVAAGSYRLDLQWASLNEGRLTLTPAPQVGADATDGSVEVGGAIQPFVAPAQAPGEAPALAMKQAPAGSSLEKSATSQQNVAATSSANAFPASPAAPMKPVEVFVPVEQVAPGDSLAPPRLPSTPPVAASGTATARQAKAEAAMDAVDVAASLPAQFPHNPAPTPVAVIAWSGEAATQPAGLPSVAGAPAWTRDFLEPAPRAGDNPNSRIKLTVPVTKPVAPELRAQLR
jgi:hypothetical protein